MEPKPQFFPTPADFHAWFESHRDKFHEQFTNAQLTRERAKQFRANNAAWEFFRSQPPWYQRVTTYWVISAKKEETKLRRLSLLIENSQSRRSIRQLTPTKKK